MQSWNLDEHPSDLKRASEQVNDHFHCDQRHEPVSKREDHCRSDELRDADDDPQLIAPILPLAAQQDSLKCGERPPQGETDDGDSESEYRVLFQIWWNLENADERGHSGEQSQREDPESNEQRL